MALNETVSTAVSVDPLADTARESHSVHWRAVFAGAFIAILVYFILMSLGVAIGGMGAANVMEGESSPRAFGVSAGIWTLCSVLISLFAGSYASSRVSGMIATRVGYVQGGVVASLFFLFMMSQVGVAMGLFSQGLAGAGIGARDLARDPAIIGLVEDSIGDLNFRSAPEHVAAGVSTRLLRGDMDSATTFLASQSGISREEALGRLQMLTLEFQAMMNEAGQRAASVARNVGWTAFGSMLLGAICAMLGGALGAQLNLRKPVDRMDRSALKRQRPAYV